MINHCEFIGWIGHDLKLEKTTKNVPVVNFSMSTVESYRDRKTKKKGTITSWHKIVAYDRMAENIVKYASKGCLLRVEAKHAPKRSWEDKQGNIHDVSEFIVKKWDLMPAGKPKPESKED